MSDAERIWREKSDEELLQAAAALDEFTEQGRAIIREELRRRGFEDPIDQGSPAWSPWTDASGRAIECLRCQTPLRYVSPDKEGPLTGVLTGRHLPLYASEGVLQLYACPRCGHVELFMNPREREEG